MPKQAMSDQATSGSHRPVLVRPWYREPLVWLLILPPAGAVVGGIVTAWLAGGPPEMVTRDEAALAVQTDQGFVRDRAAVLAREAERRGEAPNPPPPGTE